MDAKITLAFDEEVIKSAKAFAERQNMSLSRLMEHLLRQITSGEYADLESLPIADWVAQVAEGEATYRTKSKGKKQLRSEFYEKK